MDAVSVSSTRDVGVLCSASALTAAFPTICASIPSGAQLERNADSFTIFTLPNKPSFRENLEFLNPIGIFIDCSSSLFMDLYQVTPMVYFSTGFYDAINYHKLLESLIIESSSAPNK